MGQAVPRRLVNVRIPRILIGMQGASLRGDNFVLPPDHEHLDVAEEHERRPGCTIGQSWLWDDQV